MFVHPSSVPKTSVRKHKPSEKATIKKTSEHASYFILHDEIPFKKVIIILTMGTTILMSSLFTAHEKTCYHLLTNIR